MHMVELSWCRQVRLFRLQAVVSQDKRQRGYSMDAHEALHKASPVAEHTASLSKPLAFDNCFAQLAHARPHTQHTHISGIWYMSFWLQATGSKEKWPQGRMHTVDQKLEAATPHCWVSACVLHMLEVCRCIVPVKATWLRKPVTNVFIQATC